MDVLIAWMIVLGTMLCGMLLMMMWFGGQVRAAGKPRRRWPRGSQVGWMRTHWRHWEPIVWGDDRAEVWDQLCAVASTDEDGERVVLPRGQHPVELCHRDFP